MSYIIFLLYGSRRRNVAADTASTRRACETERIPGSERCRGQGGWRITEPAAVHCVHRRTRQLPYIPPITYNHARECRTKDVQDHGRNITSHGGKRGGLEV